jgi:hypothetical protein
MSERSALLGTSAIAPDYKTEASAGPDLLITVEAAKYLRLAPQTLSRWRCEGRGPGYHRLGGRIFYARPDLDAFIAAGRVHGPADAA